MRKLQLTSLFGLIIVPFMGFSQNVVETFNSTRIINGHSVETLKKRYLEYRIEHRFGDIKGGAAEGFGFDQASDIRFALEYGLSDKLMLGFGRSKGDPSAYKSVLDGFVKYKLLSQNKEKMPISMTFVGSALLSYAPESLDTNSVGFFPKFAHRMAYSSQLNIARKFSDRLSISVMPTYVYRNYVLSNDENGVFALGSAVSFKLSKSWAILAEYYHTLSSSNELMNRTNSFAIGAEWYTNGHNFHFNLTNASLLNEAQFIPATRQKWSAQEFRIGFSISRNFKR